MDHHHDSVSTPWNPNVSYAIYWSIALGVPTVWLSGRSAVSFVNKAIEHWRQKYHAHTRLASEEPDEDEDHHQQISGGVAAEQDKAAHTQTRRWSFSRLENWVVNKASATLYLGSVVHLVGGATLLALIFLSILAVVLLLDTDLALNSNRAGYLGLACIPFLFAFTGKNSIISYLTGLSHHRVNQAHRFLGICLFILISVHMGFMIHSWLPWKEFLAQQLALPKVKFGLASYTTLCLIVVTASWPMRRWAYEAFVVSHSLFLVFLVLVGLHTPYAMRFIVAGVFFYLLNVLTGWCVKTHSALARATVFEDRMTRLWMDKNLLHSPGQHIYVCVPSMSLIQWHPFTISSTNRNSLTIHARAVGGFTKSLCRWPDNTPRRVILSGPYGESVYVGRRMDVHKTVFVAAGSGLAYIVPILMDLLQHRQTKSCNAPVEVAWCVRDPDEVQWFQEELELILDAARGFHESEKDKEDMELISSESPEVQIRLNIYYSTLSFEDQESIVVAAPPMTSPAPGRLVLANSTSNNTTTTAVTSLNVPFSGDDRVVWIRERLDVGGYIRSQIEEVPEEQTVEIVGCGPPLMLAQLHNAVAANEQLSGCRVDLHTERFYM
ncbi:hypothetical protein BG006_007180 [Podila minutissima]|uniref:ferric-chelate reductase (NADPH) n=1 Tax=Podila minutissima TaxID=64525 RepID=A0A9P5SI75_9FUNG|nr:hypothetical protein BG006_007180 [Podila minutissima]